MEMMICQLATPGTRNYKNMANYRTRNAQYSRRTKGKNEKVYKRKKKGREEFYHLDNNTYSHNYEAIGRH